MIEHSASRSRVLFFNSLMSCILRGLNILIGFILVPILIGYLSEYEYGIWVALVSILGWISFFDLGFGHGLKNRLGEALAKKDLGIGQELVSTAYFYMLLLSISFIIISVLIAYSVNWNYFLNIPPSQVKDLNLIILSIGISTSLSFIFRLIDSMLFALNRTSIPSLLVLLSQSFILLYIILLKYFYKDGDLLGVILGLTFIPLIIYIISNFYFFIFVYKNLTPSLKCVETVHFKSLFGLGHGFFIIQLGVLIMFQSQNYVILQMFGPSSVTEYNIVYKIFTIVYLFLSIIMPPFWSSVINAYTTGDLKWITKTINILLGLFILLCIVIYPLLYYFSDKIFKFWLNYNFHTSNLLIVITIIYTIILSLMTIAMNFVNGVSKIRIQMILYILAIFINIPLSIYLCKEFGIPGVLISSSIIFSFMCVVLWVQMIKILNGSANGIWNK